MLGCSPPFCLPCTLLYLPARSHLAQSVAAPHLHSPATPRRPSPSQAAAEHRQPVRGRPGLQPDALPVSAWHFQCLCFAISLHMPFAGMGKRCHAAAELHQSTSDLHCTHCPHIYRRHMHPDRRALLAGKEMKAAMVQLQLQVGAGLGACEQQMGKALNVCPGPPPSSLSSSRPSNLCSCCSAAAGVWCCQTPRRCGARCSCSIPTHPLHRSANSSASAPAPRLCRWALTATALRLRRQRHSSTQRWRRQHSARPAATH